MSRKRKSNMNSPDPAEMQRLKKILKSIPDIQQEKIDEIKKKIENGEYSINADAVVSRMIELTQGIEKMTPKIKTNK